MKKCFTIYHTRTTEEFSSFYRLLENNIYQAIEIVYPYQLDKINFDIYTRNVTKLITTYPNTEVVLHLPHGPNNDLCKLETRELIIKRMKEAIQYANQFSVKKCPLHLGYVNNLNDRESLQHNIINVLKDLCSFADCYNINLMIENMPKSTELGYSPEEILSIIKKVNLPNLKFIYDTGHAHVSDYEETSYIKILSQYLYHIHYSDNSGQSDEHKQIGLGTINFQAIFKALKEIDYQGLHCSEVIYKSVDDLETYAKNLDNEILK